MATYLPALQLEHEPVPGTGAKVPTEHWEQEDAPGGAKYPGSQSLQLLLPGLSANCPATHNAQVSVPAVLENEPNPQAKQVVLSAEECFPEAHGVHIVCEVKGATSPGSQYEQDDEPELSL
jgi:hypothetical protein